MCFRKISKLISFIRKCKHIWLQSITLHACVYRSIGLVKTTWQESIFTCGTSACFQSARPDTGTDVADSAAQGGRHASMGPLQGLQQQLGVTSHHRVQVDNMRPVRFMSRFPGVERKNRCRVGWTITGLIPPPSDHFGYCICTSAASADWC